MKQTAIFVRSAPLSWNVNYAEFRYVLWKTFCILVANRKHTSYMMVFRESLTDFSHPPSYYEYSEIGTISVIGAQCGGGGAEGGRFFWGGGVANNKDI
jgi:hypothetical protein